MYLSFPALEAATAPLISTSISNLTELIPFGLGLFFSDGDPQLERWSSLIGIVTAVVGNILISFALNIQRYAHIRIQEERNQRREKAKSISKASQTRYGTLGQNDRPVDGLLRDEDDPLRTSFHSTNSLSTQSSGCSDADHTHETTYLRSPYWWGGIVLMTVGEAGNFLAYGFAPASIVSPLGVVALISNCVIAPIMLKEPFRLRDFWGVVVAVAGAVTVVFSAKQQEKKFGPHEVWGAITTPEFEIYMGATALLIAILVWASPRYGNRTILIDLGLVGLFGAYTALSTKGVASMLSYTLWRALTTPVTYALLAVLMATAVLQVKYVNRALQRFDSTQVIPVQFVMFTLSVIIGSAVLFRDFEKTNPENVSKFIGGCLLTFFGVFLITSGRPPRDEDEDDSDEGEERIGLMDQAALSIEETGFQNGSRGYDSERRKSVLVQNGDAADDLTSSGSRRSSHVSFAETVPRPQTPRVYSNPGQPSARVPPVPAVEVTHGSEETPLSANPWRNSADDLLQALRHPGMQSTTSSAVLPSEAPSSSESLKPPTPPTARANSQGNFHTHPNHQHGPAPPQAERPSTPARHSMDLSRMMPGPLISPLSGGLSVVVADSLMRGMDSPIRNRNIRRPRDGLGRTKSGSQRFSQADAEALVDEAAAASVAKTGDSAEGSLSKSLGTEEAQWSQRMTRARSFSNTLGDLFRGKSSSQKKDGEHNHANDEEAGPSGS